MGAEPTSRTRWTIIGGLAAAVLVAAIALILANRGGAKAGAQANDHDTAATPVARGDEPASPPGAAPSLTAGTAATPVVPTREQDPPTVDTVSDNGAAVHDHRANPGEIHDHPVLPTHGPAVFVSNDFAAGVGNVVTPIARACTAQIPADARGDKPVIQVQMTVTIKDGKMTVDDVDTQLTGITGDQSSVKDCVKAKAGSISIDATGQPDVDHYAITMPMRVAS